jgi:putative oxidoreductase
MPLGLFTRPVAFVLSGEMAVAYFYGHYFSSAGAGPWSIDALRRPEPTPRP